MNLTGKVAIITGGARGIGEAITRELAAAGARVVINYARSAAAAEALAAALGGLAVEADISTPAGAKALVDAARALGSIDVLVNNAGITKDGLMLRMSDEDWRGVMDLNLDGVFRMCRDVSAVMLSQRRGSIINITSLSGVRGNAGQANYAASKAAVAALSRSLAKELAKRNIRVNCVAPGFIDTDMVRAMDPRIVEGVTQAVPMRRVGKASEVAKVVRFLASDDASYVTGQEWLVDGGLGV
jgi:3-oxoacyl-[acyl-carrier protein] reductase